MEGALGEVSAVPMSMVESAPGRKAWASFDWLELLQNPWGSGIFSGGRGEVIGAS